MICISFKIKEIEGKRKLSDLLSITAMKGQGGDLNPQSLALEFRIVYYPVLRGQALLWE